MTNMPRPPARFWTTPLLILALALVAAPGCNGRNVTAARASGPKGPEAISALGRIVPLGGVIELGGPVGSQIESVEAVERTEVQKGAVLVKLDDHDLLEAELALIDAQLVEARHLAEAADAEWEQLRREMAFEKAKAETLARLDVEAQRQKVSALMANVSKLKDEQATLEKLAGAQSRAVSNQEVLGHAILLARGQAEHQEADSVLKKLVATQELESQRLRLEEDRGRLVRDRAKLAGGIETLAKKKRLAELRLERANIKAPIDGTILRVMAHPGESIGPGPVILMGDTRTMAVVAEVSEQQIGKLKQWVDRAGAGGLVARATLPGLKVWGHVRADGIDPIIGRARTAGVDPSIDVDDRVVEVKVVLELPAGSEIKSLVRLPVEVRIWDNSVTSGDRPKDDEDDGTGGAPR